MSFVQMDTLVDKFVYPTLSILTVSDLSGLDSNACGKIIGM